MRDYAKHKPNNYMRRPVAEKVEWVLIRFALLGVMIFVLDKLIGL